MKLSENKSNIEVIVIGGSAGSLDFFLDLIPKLPQKCPVPIIIVIHRNVECDGVMETVLQSRSRVTVKEAEMNEPITPDRVYLATPDYHLLIEDDRRFCLDISLKENYSRPSIDLAFYFAANVYRSNTLGILLSGANEDGAWGIGEIADKGGLTIVQHPDDAAISVMPRAAIRMGNVEKVMRASEIEEMILEIEEMILDKVKNS